MTAAVASPSVPRLVAAWEAVMVSRSPGWFLYKLTPDQGAGFLLWTQGGDVAEALAESHRLVACCPAARYPFWKAVQAALRGAHE
jgi:hypothetical protein